MLALTIHPFGTGIVYAGNPIEFDIEPQPLDSALRSFIEQSQLDLLYSPEKVRGMSTDGVSGAEEPEDALRLLLVGSGLSIEPIDSGYLLVSADGTLAQRGEALTSITVTATRTERNVHQVPASVSVVTADEIRKQPVLNPEELLLGLPGVDISYKSSISAPSVPIVRGAGLSFSGSTTRLLLNGMSVEPIGQPSRNYWYPINLNNIDRIELVRGPASVLYGPSAMGGVVNVITKRGAGEPYGYIHAGGGSHIAQDLSAGAGGSFGDFDLQLNARTYETDGYKPLPETPAPYATFPYPFTDLEGRGGKESQYDMRITWWMDSASDLTLGLQQYDNEGVWLGGHPNYDAKNEGDTIDLAYQTRFTGGQELKIKFLVADTESWFKSDFYYFNGSLDETKREHETRKTRSVDIQFDLQPMPGNTLTLGGVYGDDDVVYDGYSPGGAERTSRRINKSRQYGVLIQDEHNFEQMTLTGGIRYDKYEFYDDERNGIAYPDSDDRVFTPRLGLSYRLHDGLVLYGSAGTAYIPAPNSLKFSSRDTWLNNPDLEPESSVSYETGVKLVSSDGRLNGSAALYHSTYEDRISSAEVSSGLMQYQNIGEIESTGVEIELNGKLARYWKPFFNYTYTDAEITENPANTSIEGNVPAYVAKHKANIGLTYDNPDLFSAYAISRYVGNRYFMDNNADNTKTGSHIITDVKLSKDFTIGSGPELSASFSVNNLFDRDAYGYFFFEKLDGRNFWLELEARF